MSAPADPVREDPLAAGRELGPYLIEGRLGAGGMGEVYRAYDRRLERAVAIKVVRRPGGPPAAEGAPGEDGPAPVDDARRRRMQGRFLAEARAAAALSHPAIVQIFDILDLTALDSGPAAPLEGAALVLELVAGETLARRLAAAGRLAPAAAVELGRQIAGGLAAAHAAGIVHRDLKPSNVMLTPADRVKILDFGIARRLAATAPAEDSTVGPAWGIGGAAPAGAGEVDATAAGRRVGTSRAMSPEQARGLPVGPASDLFALGSLLYELVSGRHPFPGATEEEVLVAICSRPPARLDAVGEPLPPRLVRLVERLLEKEPARRPESAAEVEAELAEIAAELGGETAGGPRTGAAAAASGSLAAGELGAGELGGGETILDDGTVAGAAGDPASGHRASRLGTTTLFDGQPAALQRRLPLLVLAALLIVAGAAAVWLLPARRPPLTVAVPQPVLAAGASQAAAGGDPGELLAAGLRLALERGLLAFRGVRPVAAEELEPLAGSDETASGAVVGGAQISAGGAIDSGAIARATAADELLTARLDCAGELCQVALARRDRGGALLWSDGFRVPIDQPHLLEEPVRGLLARAYPDRRLRPGAAPLAAAPDDYEELLQLQALFSRSEEEALPVGRLLDRLAALRRSSPAFLEALVFEARVLRYRFEKERDEGDLERALALLAEAQRLDPGDPRPLLTRFDVALAGERLAEAEGALDRLSAQEPGDPELLSLTARLLERRGEGRAALAPARRAVALRPSWRHLFRLAGLEARLGENAAARATLDRLLERFPEHYAGRSLLAQLELLSGSPERAAELYRQLVERSPQLTELTNLGVALFLLRRWEEAEATLREARRLAPDNPFVLLNLADALLMQAEEAAAAGGASSQAGAAAVEARQLYRQVDAIIASDPAADHWQLRTARAQALAHLAAMDRPAEGSAGGDPGPGVDELRAAARREVAAARAQAPDNPQLAYEAAVVHAVLGEMDDALAAARQALAGGVEERWFGFPWFDPLRGELPPG